MGIQMGSVIYPSAVYGFLGFIHQYERINKVELGRKILDCAAGGRKPPLGLFHEHGFETYGIDISQEQIDTANEFAIEHKMNLNISRGDMRDIPFEDETFDFVYEYYSKAHLTKEDIRTAINEMGRVLKPGGFLFLGFMLYDTWPIYGQERKDGEFWLFDNDEEFILSFFRKDEIAPYLDGFKLSLEEESSQRFPWRIERLSSEEWNKRYDDRWTAYTRSEWEKMYDEVNEKSKYSHIFYIIQKE